MAPRKQQPMLMRSGLTGRVWVVLRYKDLGQGRYESLEKYDVTEQFSILVSAAMTRNECIFCGSPDASIGLSCKDCWEAE